MNKLLAFLSFSSVLLMVAVLSSSGLHVPSLRAEPVAGWYNKRSLCNTFGGCNSKRAIANRANPMMLTSEHPQPSNDDVEQQQEWRSKLALQIINELESLAEAPAGDAQFQSGGRGPRAGMRKLRAPSRQHQMELIDLLRRHYLDNSNNVDAAKSSVEPLEAARWRQQVLDSANNVSGGDNL